MGVPDVLAGEASSRSVGSRLSSWKNVETKIATGRRKQTPAERAERLFKQLINVLHTEWKTIRSLNLGVSSGTSIVDSLIIQKLQQWIKELHILCISEVEASKRLGQLARKLDSDEMRELQVMLDSSNSSDLSDFIRILVFNVSDPFASQPVTVHSVSSASRSARLLSQGRTQRISKTAAIPFKPSTVSTHSRRECREEIIRFTGLLPLKHPLVLKAQELHRLRLPDEGETEDLEGASVSDQEDEEQAAALRGYHVAIKLGPCRLRELVRPPLQPSQPPPIYSDIEARWQKTIHTFDKEKLLNKLMIGPPLPAWSFVPEYKERHLAELRNAEEKNHPRLATQSSNFDGGVSIRDTLRNMSRGARSIANSTLSNQSKALGGGIRSNRVTEAGTPATSTVSREKSTLGSLQVEVSS